MAEFNDSKQIQELTELIKNSGIAKIETLGVDFCSVWPSARSALTALQGILASIPGVSMFAGAAISLVIAAGNAASDALCKK